MQFVFLFNKFKIIYINTRYNFTLYNESSRVASSALSDHLNIYIYL